jgi:thiol-disulfide isomerase/thioredoxin
MNIKFKLLAGVVVIGAVALGGYAALHSAPSGAPPQEVASGNAPPPQDATRSGGPPLQGAMARFQPTTALAAAPAVDFTDEAGNHGDLSRFKGKLTLLNLWATWCAPCIREMPSLARLKTARNNDRFEVVTVSQDLKGAAVVDEFFAKNDIGGLPRYVDPKNTFSQGFRINGMPTTLLLDRDGRELGRLEGVAEWDGPDAQHLIDWYLAHPSSPG